THQQHTRREGGDRNREDLAFGAEASRRNTLRYRAAARAIRARTCFAWAAAFGGASATPAAFGFALPELQDRLAFVIGTTTAPRVRPDATCFAFGRFAAVPVAV